MFSLSEVGMGSLSAVRQLVNIFGNLSRLLPLALFCCQAVVADKDASTNYHELVENDSLQ